MPLEPKPLNLGGALFPQDIDLYTAGPFILAKLENLLSRLVDLSFCLSIFVEPIAAGSSAASWLQQVFNACKHDR